MIEGNNLDNQSNLEARTHAASPGCTFATIIGNNACTCHGLISLTGAFLNRLTHHVRILEVNGDSYSLTQSRAKQLKDNS
nr:ATP-binding protein [Ruegeria lacuscaerulensis]